MSETNEFLKELDVKDNKSIFDEPLEDENSEKEKASEEDLELKAKNRRERRLLEKNQQLREEAIDLAARLQTIKESEQIRGESNSEEYLERIKKIYGDETPEAKEATNLLIEALKGVEESAINKAYSKISSEKEEEAKAVEIEEKNLDEISEHWEDNYGIDMSNDSVKKGIFTLMEKLSPKDKEGNIKEFADEDAVAELYLANQEKSSSRAKNLASRSMTSSNGTRDSKLATDTAERFLKEHGII